MKINVEATDFNLNMRVSLEMTEKGKCHIPPKLFILTVSGTFANFMTFLEAKSYA